MIILHFIDIRSIRCVNKLYHKRPFALESDKTWHSSKISILEKEFLGILKGADDDTISLPREAREQGKNERAQREGRGHGEETRRIEIFELCQPSSNLSDSNANGLINVKQKPVTKTKKIDH
ncbi:hypothetical protein PRIPAC_77243 [Pristionchus pacificus]|uniref:Uncharacterized protein n=1 Tax=Pristionchus pacificus TaxID=54126 RepID=A0A2A6CK90_PRIPA|nr:hypothetical protein PRIPAC_77243 [Pristionchus pacificus]|eukprot:PDM78612.1 hypothetical protein PRIPAC_31191 [Pristionchus pacificus]